MPQLNETSFWILTALADGPRHGYAILGEVASLSEGAVALRITTLYAALERLEQAGHIDRAGDEIVEGRARRYYSLAPAGRGALEAELERLRLRTRAVRTALRRAAATSRATA